MEPSISATRFLKAACWIDLREYLQSCLGIVELYCSQNRCSTNSSPVIVVHSEINIIDSRVAKNFPWEPVCLEFNNAMLICWISYFSFLHYQVQHLWQCHLPHPLKLYPASVHQCASTLLLKVDYFCIHYLYNNSCSI